jgi:hypothetical protein
MQSDFFYGKICWRKLNKIVICPYFAYKNLGEGLIRSFVQEISFKDKFDNIFLENYL